MATITAAGLSKQIGARTLFDGVSFKLERGERMTLSGRNGSGKTTLLRVLAGEAGLDAGTFSLGKGVRVALHDQRPPRGEATLRDYVTAGLDWILGIERELGRLEERMAAGEAGEATLAAYAEAQARLEHAGGYRWRDGVVAALRGLGFADQELDRSLAGFSGGELTRASLARALASAPDLLLLDEPTNHLDIESLEWLEGYLTSVDAAVVLVAHDRWFLEAVGTSVLELEGGRGRFFAGPWHAWRAERAARELATERDRARREAEIARMERFVERFRAKATKARQAQSKRKAIERLRAGTPEAAAGDGRSLRFSFGAAERSGRLVLELERATIAIGDRTLIEEATMWLERGEHVTLVGPNGSGKSTLVSILVGERELEHGTLRRGHRVRLGYLAQHTEVGGPSDHTVLAHAQRRTGLSEARSRALLGRFLFSGEEVQKRLGELSGGESQRLALALLTSSDANLLILDEPTNHLDVESREALEDALRAFEGTVLLVSHDRALLEAVGARTIAIEEGRLRTLPGGWAEVRAAREAERRGPADRPRAPRRAKPPGPSKNRRARIERLEGEVELAEAELRALEDELADPAHWSDPERAAAATRRHREAESRLAEAEARWERAASD